MSLVPTVNIYKDGKMMICNKSDLDRFQAEGWALQEAEQPKPQPKRVKANTDAKTEGQE